MVFIGRLLFSPRTPAVTLKKDLGQTLMLDASPEKGKHWTVVSICLRGSTMSLETFLNLK